ncbi:MAG: response regulator [Chloroflexota bacterium]
MEGAPRILVVDDDPDIVQAVQIVLEAQDYQVITAANGDEGLERIRRDKPDVLVLDLLMPKKDGFAVVRELKEDPRQRKLPILILSSVREDASRRRYELETGVELDVDDYVEKPILPVELIQRVANLVRRARPTAKKILLVDDDPDFIETTRIVLASRAYNVLSAGNGEEAMHMIRKEKPDLIILDVIMPTKDGFLTCEELKKDPDLQHIPVLMLTSLAQKLPETNYSMQQGMMLEADDFVDKPVAPEELLMRVERLLHR